MSKEPTQKERMYRAEAESYVLKTAPSEELLGAIRGESQTCNVVPCGSTA